MKTERKRICLTFEYPATVGNSGRWLAYWAAALRPIPIPDICFWPIGVAVRDWSYGSIKFKAGQISQRVRGEISEPPSNLPVRFCAIS
jgi:hypothetical protein